MTFDPPTMVRCPQCCVDPRAEPDDACTLCKGLGKVNPAAATFWRAANVVNEQSATKTEPEKQADAAKPKVVRERTILGVAPPPEPVPALELASDAPKPQPERALETHSDEPAKSEPARAAASTPEPAKLEAEPARAPNLESERVKPASTVKPEPVEAADEENVASKLEKEPVEAGEALPPTKRERSEPRVRPKREGGTRAWMVAVLLVAAGVAYMFRDRIASVIARERALTVATTVAPNVSAAPSTTSSETMSAAPTPSSMPIVDASTIVAVTDASANVTNAVDARLRDAGPHDAGRHHRLPTAPARPRPTATAATDNPY